MIRRIVGLVAILLSILFWTTGSFAATITWTNGNSNNLWNDAGNWSGGIPGSGDLARFDGTSTANCTIDVSINVGGIDINSGFTGSLVQGDGNTITIGSSDFDQEDGRFVGGNADINFNSGTFTLDAGIFQATSATMFIDESFTITGGHFKHNNGTVEYDDNNNKNYNVPNIDTFYNFICSTTSHNKKFTIASGDTMVVVNRLTLTNGRILNNVIIALDSVVISSAYDAGTSSIYFQGASNGHLVMESDQGNHNFYLNKNSGVSLLVSGNSGNPALGAGHSLFVQEGVIDFSGNSSVDLNFNEIELNGGSFRACACNTNYSGDWDNNGGKFLHNNGSWEWDFTDHIDFRSTVIDTFYTMLLDQNTNKKLTFSTTDTALVLNKLEWNEGRFENAFVRVVDTLEFNSGADDNPTTIEFVGSGNGHLVSNSTDAGNTDIIVTKSSISDTVFIADENGGSVNVGTTDAFFRLNQGTVAFVNTEADVDYEEIELNGGRFQATTGNLTYQGAWDNNGGRFLHNTSNWIWNMTDHRSFTSTKIDTFYNMLLSQNTNKQVEMTGSDTCLVLNRLEWNDGRFLNGAIKVVDTLEFNSGADDNQTYIEFVGSGTGHLVSNSTAAGNTDIVIKKASQTDTVYVTDEDAGSVNVGTDDAKLSINRGVLAFLNTDADIDYEEIELNGGTLLAPSGTASVQSTWDNNGGKFRHNNATWQWDFTDHRSMRTTVVDTFYNMILNQSDNKYLNFDGTETFLILNKMTWNNGRISAGRIHIVDTLEINSGIDDDQAFIHFVGTGTSTLRINSTNGANLYFTVNKTNATDSVIITDSDAGRVTLGPSSDSLTINRGIVAWGTDVTDAHINVVELELNSGGTLIGASDTTYFNGRWDNNGGSYVHSNGTFRYVPDDHRAWNSTVSDVFYKFVINPTSGDKEMQMAAGDTIRIMNDLHLLNGRISAGVIALQGDLTMNSNYDDPFSGQPTLLFEGPNPQAVNASGAASDFNGDVIINKSKADTITLNSDFEFNATGQVVTFTKGFIKSTSANLFHLTSNDATVAGGNDSSFVAGPFAKTNTAATTFIVGDSLYGPVTLRDNAGAGNSFSIQYHRNDPTVDGFDTGSLDAGIVGVSSVEYWDINRLAGSSSTKVELIWDTHSGVSDPSDLIVAHWDSGDSRWESEGGTDISGDANSGTVRSNAITSFSPFTIGTTSSNNILPIELLDFAVSRNGDDVDIHWVTAAEINNDYFELLRSPDGKNWEVIQEVDGAGNSKENLEYFEKDFNAPQEETYYRLRQTDFDGTFTESKIGVVPERYSDNFKEINLKVYPNPIHRGSKLTVETNAPLKARLLLVLQDLNGKEHYMNLVRLENQPLYEVIDIDADLPSGTYLITASSQNVFYNAKLIVQ